MRRYKAHYIVKINFVERIGSWILRNLERNCVNNFLLVFSMEHSPSWEANIRSAAQEILRLLWNTKFLYRIHNSQPLLLILSQIYPVQICIPNFLKTHLNTIHLVMVRLCDTFLSEFSNRMLFAFLFFPMRVTWPTHIIFPYFKVLNFMQVLCLWSYLFHFSVFLHCVGILESSSWL